MHGPVGLNSIGLVGILVGGGSLKRHILVLIPGAMLRYMRLNLVRWVLVLHPHHCLSRPCAVYHSANVPRQTQAQLLDAVCTITCLCIAFTGRTYTSNSQCVALGPLEKC